MARTTTLTIRVEPSVKKRLERVAKSQRRSKAFVAVDAIEDYLAVQEAQIRGIEEAIAAADRGELIPHERVKEWIESWAPRTNCLSPNHEVRMDAERAARSGKFARIYRSRQSGSRQACRIDDPFLRRTPAWQHPKSGRPGRVAGTLELVIPRLPYIVPYRIKGDAIEVLRIYHAARMWPENF